MNDAKPCPFCGSHPTIYTQGAWIEIACCCWMAYDKKTFLSPDDLVSWEPATGSYSDNAEEKAYYGALRKWNTRA